VFNDDAPSSQVSSLGRLKSDLNALGTVEEFIVWTERTRLPVRSAFREAEK
jgi:hypothetical protein